MKFSLVTPLKKMVTDLEVSEVFVPAYRGELNILPGHSALVTTLSTGILKYRPAGSSELKVAAISWGYCEVHHDEITVLAETAETAEEIDQERAQAAYQKSIDMLAGKDASPDDIMKYQNKIERSTVRLEVVKNKTQ